MRMEPPRGEHRVNIIQYLAQQAHNEVRPALDLRRDLVARLLLSNVNYAPGQSICYVERCPSKIRSGR